MPDTETTPSTSPSTAPAGTTPWARTAGRWLVTFTGFPLGGYAALRIVGPVDSLRPALVGGLLTGAILGAVQAWGLGSWSRARRPRVPADLWIAATALGLMIGLAIGAAAVDFRTTLGALVVQGAICGLAVGTLQAVVLRFRLGLGRVAFVWPPALAAIWAAGWAITTSIGIQVDEQFTVFGSSGALVVAALTVVLPIWINRTTTVTTTPEERAS